MGSPAPGKGAGEAGTVGALPAVMIAINQALYFDENGNAIVEVTLQNPGGETREITPSWKEVRGTGFAPITLHKGMLVSGDETGPRTFTVFDSRFELHRLQMEGPASYLARTREPVGLNPGEMIQIRFLTRTAVPGDPEPDPDWLKARLTDAAQSGDSNTARWETWLHQAVPMQARGDERETVAIKAVQTLASNRENSGA